MGCTCTSDLHMRYQHKQHLAIFLNLMPRMQRLAGVSGREAPLYTLPKDPLPSSSPNSRPSIVALCRSRTRVVICSTEFWGIPATGFASGSMYARSNYIEVLRSMYLCMPAAEHAPSDTRQEEKQWFLELVGLLTACTVLTGGMRSSRATAGVAAICRVPPMVRCEHREDSKVLRNGNGTQ